MGHYFFYSYYFIGGPSQGIQMECLFEGHIMNVLRNSCIIYITCNCALFFVPVDPMTMGVHR